MSLENLFGELALDATLLNRYGGGKTPVPFTVTAFGDTTIHTPAVGKFVRLFWFSAFTDPDETTSPLIKVKIGTAEFYRGPVISHWEVFDGAVNAALIVNLSQVSSVSGTAHIKEL